MEKVLTTCIYCGCGCGLYLHVEDGRILACSPAPSHPTSAGKLCIKGWLAGDFVAHPDRLRYPLVRAGDRMRRAGWDLALDTVSSRLRELSRVFGPQSLGVLTSAKGTNEENYLLMKLSRAGLFTNNVDHVARLCHAPTVAALAQSLGSGAMTNPISSLAHSDVILVVGSNTTEQHPIAAHYILHAKARGGRLIVADPRKTQLAELADFWLSFRPGTDIAWINAFLNVIIQEGLVDRQFISERTEGFESVCRSVEKYSLSDAEEICGLPKDLLRDAALAFGSADRASIVYAMGITQHSCGTDNVQALANLALATGNFGREGTGINPLRGHQNVQGACDMGALPSVYSGYQSAADPYVRAKFEAAWKVSLPDQPGLTALEMMAEAEAGRLKALLIVGENPMMSYPDQSRIRKALESLEFLAVMDIFPTQTTELADVVLPAACWAEKDGTFTSTERRIQLVSRAVDPPEEARAEWQVISELLNRLGVSCRYSSAAEVMAEIASLTPIYGGVSYDRLGSDGLQWPCPSASHPGTPILHCQEFPLGRARFRPVEHQEPAEAPDREYPMLLATGRSGYHFHSGTMTRRTSLLDREVPSLKVAINPLDGREQNIKAGQRVVVQSRRGSIEAEADLCDEVPRGMLFLPIHFSEACPNALTGQVLDEKSKIPELKVWAAKIMRRE